MVTLRGRDGWPAIVGGPGIARYGVGVVCLILITMLFGSAAAVARRRWMPGASGVAVWLADAVIALALLFGELELLGAVGLFRLAPIMLGAALICAGVHTTTRTPVSGGAARSQPSARPHPSRTVFAIGVLAAVVVIAEWAVPTIKAYDIGMRSLDSLWYHMPWAASFAETGWVTPLRFTDVEYLTAFYPATAELLHGLGIVLLARDALSPALNLIWLGLVLLAAYCIGRPRGLGASTLLGAALVCSTPMFVVSQAGTASSDVAGAFFLLAAIALVPAGHGTGAIDRESAVALSLAAVAAGLAVSVKLTLLAPVACLTLGVIWIAPAGARRRVTAHWIAPLALSGCYWYVRNLLAVGNPLPWIALPGLPVPAAALQQHTSFSVAHYITDTHVLTTMFHVALANGLGGWWPMLLVAAVGGPVLCLARAAEPRTRILGAVALMSLAAYLLTPETAAGPSGHPFGFAFNLRYCAPALLLSFTILPLAPALSGRRMRVAVAVVLAAALVATAVNPALWNVRHRAAALALGALAVLTCFAVERLRGTRLTRGRIAVAGTVLLILAAVGYPWQQHYLQGRYASLAYHLEPTRLWTFFRDISGTRIGLVGTFGSFYAYPLYGSDDTNRVQYVAARGPHGSFTSITSCPAWRRAVNAGRYRYLVTTPARDPWRSQLEHSPETAWTAGAPAAHAVLRYFADHQPTVVFELDGRLNPATCSASAVDSKW